MSIVQLPKLPPALPGSEIASGAAVLGATWGTAADLANYLTGKGSQLVCANRPNLTVSAMGSGSLRYYVWPRAVHARRVWVLGFSAASGALARVTVTDVANFAKTAVKVRVPNGAPWNLTSNVHAPFLFVGEYTAGSTPGEITLQVEPVGNDIVILSASCFELPRSRLEIGAEDSAGDCGGGFPIYEGAGRSIYGIAQAAEAGRTKQKRANFHWFNATGYATTSATFSSVFYLDPKCLAPMGSITNGDKAEVTVAARLQGAMTDAELRVTAASGDTVTLTRTGGAGAGWVAGTMEIDREDLDDADSGGRSGRSYGDELTFELRTTSGGDTATVTGIAVGGAGPV